MEARLRKLLLIFTLIFTFALTALTATNAAAQCVKVNGWAQLGGQVVTTSGTTSTSKAQKSYPSSTVTIYETGTTTLRAIYTSNTCLTAKANPFTASASDASYGFYVHPGRLDFRFSGTGIITPFTISDIAVNLGDVGIFNAQDFGWTADGIDRSVRAQAMLDAICPSGVGGGTIYFPPSPNRYRADSQLFIPNDGASPQPSQCNLRFTGAGGGGAWYGVNASVLDLRYHAVDGNAKIETRGKGTLLIDNLTLMDGGSANATPFIHTTNTTLKIRSNTFIGTGVWVGAEDPSNIATTQDAIVLGGATNNIDGSLTATFQGYGTIIDSNHFRQLNRGVYGRWNANAVVVTNNNWQGNTGTRAIEFSGVVGNPDLLTSGLTITGNTIEMDAYTYGVVLTNTIESKCENAFYDAGNAYLGSYFLTDSPTNVIDRTATPGYGPDLIAGDAASKTATIVRGGPPAPAVGTGTNSQTDVFGLGNTTAELGNNLIVRGDYNNFYRLGYPGQLALASALTPQYVLRMGYNFVTGDYAFIDSYRASNSGKPLLLNPTEILTAGGNTSAPVGVGNMPYTALAAPLHVGVDASANAQRWGDTTNTNYLHLLVGGVSTTFSSSANRNFILKSNSTNGITLAGSGELLFSQDGQATYNKFVNNTGAIAWRAADSTGTSTIDLVNGGLVTRLGISGSRPFSLRVNGIDGLTVDGAGNVTTALGIRSGTASNTDLAGQLTIGGGATITYTFTQTYASAPICIVTQTSAPTLIPWVGVSTTVLTIHGDIGGVVNYICAGRN